MTNQLPPQAYELMEARDEEQILAEINGNIITEMFYSFRMDGREVTGISWVGTKEVARQYGGVDMDLLRVDDLGAAYVAVAKATDTRRGVSLLGSAMQSKTMAVKGEEQEDRFAYTKAVSKAQRNAIRAIIPEKFLLEIKESVAMLAQAHLKGSLKGSGPAYSLAAQILQVVEGEAWAVSLPQVAIGARIMVAREAITKYRKELHLEEALMENLRPATEPERRALHPWGGGRENWPISYGFIGLLDYISTGDPEKILAPTLRSAIKKTLRAWPQIIEEALT